MRSMPPTSAIRARGGFTLMEVIVSLVVSSIALAAGFATLSFVEERSRAGEVAAIEALEGAAGRMLLIDWLAGARRSSPVRAVSFDQLVVNRESTDPRSAFGVNDAPVTWTNTFTGLSGEENGLATDEIIFPTTARTPLHVPNTIVHLYVDVDEQTPERGLVAELTERPLDVPRRVELLPQVANMELRYLPDVEGGVDDVEWEPGWAGRDALPKAVELVLFAAPGDSLPPLLRYPIRVPLGTLR